MPYSLEPRSPPLLVNKPKTKGRMEKSPVTSLLPKSSTTKHSIRLSRYGSYGKQSHGIALKILISEQHFTTVSQVPACSSESGLPLLDEHCIWSYRKQC